MTFHVPALLSPTAYSQTPTATLQEEASPSVRKKDADVSRCSLPHSLPLSSLFASPLNSVAIPTLPDLTAHETVHFVEAKQSDREGEREREKEGRGGGRPLAIPRHKLESVKEGEKKMRKRGSKEVKVSRNSRGRRSTDLKKCEPIHVITSHLPHRISDGNTVPPLLAHRQLFWLVSLLLRANPLLLPKDVDISRISFLRRNEEEMSAYRRILMSHWVSETKTVSTFSVTQLLSLFSSRTSPRPLTPYLIPPVLNKKTERARAVLRKRLTKCLHLFPSLHSLCDLLAFPSSPAFSHVEWHLSILFFLFEIIFGIFRFGKFSHYISFGN